VAYPTKLQRLEIEIRVLMEHALTSGDRERYEYIKRHLGEAPLTPYNAYTPELFEYLGEQRRAFRNAVVHGRSRILSPTLSDGHLNRLLGELFFSRNPLRSHPRWAEYLLYFFLPKEDRESIPGDLIEEYAIVVVPRFGRWFANVWFVKQVAGSIWPVLWRRLLKVLGIVEIIRRLHG